jgi:hypothetical protein
LCSSEYIPPTPSFTPSPEFDLLYKACRKGDRDAKAVVVGWSIPRVIADASEMTGLPRDEFDVFEISKAEFEAFRSS